ncbi:MAG: hypothetical protein ACW96U_05775 [Candidatus Heimdallarchaeaceae archaeon]|jgi:hypothetical protein
MKNYELVANAKVLLEPANMKHYLIEWNLPEVKRRTMKLMERIYPLGLETKRGTDIFTVLLRRPEFNPAFPTLNVKVKRKDGNTTSYLLRGVTEEGNGFMGGYISDKESLRFLDREVAPTLKFTEEKYQLI